MAKRWSLPLFLAALLPITGIAQEKGKFGRTYEIPFRLTKSQHMMVRVKIDGQGPFHFILDTGAPIVILSKEAAKKLKIETDKGGWTKFKDFAVEGGLNAKKVKCLITTPYQLTGMNSLGLAGAELHGIIGYTFLAKYKMHFNLAGRKLKWTELVGFEPPPPQGLRIKGGKNPTGSMEMMAGLIKFLSAMIGTKAQPTKIPRGFLGIQLMPKKGPPVVAQALPNSPAAKAGLHKGDRILKFGEHELKDAADLHRRTEKLTADTTVQLTIVRDEETKTITITAENGL